VSAVSIVRTCLTHQACTESRGLEPQVQELAGQLRPAVEGCSDDPPLVALFLAHSAVHAAAVIACLSIGRETTPLTAQRLKVQRPW